MNRAIGVAVLIAMMGVTAQAQENPPSNGTMPAGAISFSPEAVNRAFSQLSEDERYVIQQRLERRGFYDGTVDGLTGPGTREAIRQQAAAVLAAGEQVRVDTEEGARTFLMSLLPMPAEELPEGDAFFGVWDCEGGPFSYRYDGYATSPYGVHLPYMSIEEFTPGNFGITYMDGDRTGLMDVTPSTMTWSSPASGDIFECRRISAPPPRLGVGVAEQPPVREPIETAPPASPAVDTPMPSQPETKPTAATSVPAATVWPFEGAWSCVSDAFGAEPMTFRFGSESVAVPAFSSTVGYADVAMIGGRETAYLVSLMDGQQVGLLEIEPERMIFVAAISLFDCSRETQP
jgi:hypothetical protein